MSQKKKICFIVAIPGTAQSFLKDQIKELSKSFDVYLVFDHSVDPLFTLAGLSDTHHVEIKRNISLTTDLRAVGQLAAYFRQMKFDAVHSITPKAGLVTALAARLAGVKHRIHIFSGQVWATRTGAMRLMLKSLDKLIARLNNHILVDGKSQRQFLIRQGVITAQQSQVLGPRSTCGVDTDRFNPSPEVREQQRRQMNIPEGKLVFAFMGRLNRDKGVYELFAAFNALAAIEPDAFLLLLGNDEEGCMDHIGEYPNIVSGQNFLYYGPTPTPETTLQAADIFCLPSYREGLGMSVIEASCLGLPVICSDIYGMADTMVDNETGLRCKVADVGSLLAAMQHFCSNPDECRRMGENGRQRVLNLFPASKILAHWKTFYHSILQ